MPITPSLHHSITRRPSLYYCRKNLVNFYNKRLIVYIEIYKQIADFESASSDIASSGILSQVCESVCECVLVVCSCVHLCLCACACVESTLLCAAVDCSLHRFLHTYASLPPSLPLLPSLLLSFPTGEPTPLKHKRLLAGGQASESRTVTRNTLSRNSTQDRSKQVKATQEQARQEHAQELEEQVIPIQARFTPAPPPSSLTALASSPDPSYLARIAPRQTTASCPLSRAHASSSSSVIFYSVQVFQFGNRWSWFSPTLQLHSFTLDSLSLGGVFPYRLIMSH